MTRVIKLELELVAASAAHSDMQSLGSAAPRPRLMPLAMLD